MQTVEQIRASTSVSKRFKQHMDRLSEDPISPSLVKWGKEAVQIGKESGMDDDIIAECVEITAENCHFHRAYVSRVLRANGIRRFEHVGSDRSNMNYTPKNYLGTIRGLVRGFSGLKETEIMGMSTEELQRKSEHNVRQRVARMDEVELREYPRHVKNLRAIFEILEPMVRQKTKVASRITE